MQYESTTNLPAKTTNLVGHTFERLTVIAYAGLRGGRAVWRCRCTCGNVKDIPAKTLRNGTARSCGCLRVERLQDATKNPRPATVDLAGQVIGCWTVLEHAGVRKGHTWWRCRCVCGTTKDLPANRLKRKYSKSCGCQAAQMIGEANSKHRLSSAPEYHAYVNMIQRCTNPNTQNYDLYGGRGITVCKAWLASFEAFYADMGPRPSSKHSIDRINNELGYSKTNCRWTTRDVQAVNRRTTVWITYDGVTLCANDWAGRMDIKARNILERLRMGWSVEDALFTPVSANHNGFHRREKSSYYYTRY